LKQFLKTKLLHPHQKSFYDALNWATPEPGTTSCLQSFGIFIMMQRSC